MRTIAVRLSVAAVKVASVVLVIGAAGFAALRFADGPIGPLPGGPLRNGPMGSLTDVDWTDANGRSIELHILSSSDSRTTGLLVHEGELIVPCDLGYIAYRIPKAPMRWIAGLIQQVKHWHLEAAADGRVVFRIDGKRYPARAVRITEPARLTALRSVMETEAEAQTQRDLSAPLLNLPASPDDIWFFRLNPRPAAG